MKKYCDNEGIILILVFSVQILDTNCLGISFNPLNAELNPICHLQALLGAHHILHVFRIRVKLSLFSKSQKNIRKYK